MNTALKANVNGEPVVITIDSQSAETNGVIFNHLMNYFQKGTQPLPTVGTIWGPNGKGEGFASESLPFTNIKARTRKPHVPLPRTYTVGSTDFNIDAPTWGKFQERVLIRLRNIDRSLFDRIVTNYPPFFNGYVNQPRKTQRKVTSNEFVLDGMVINCNFSSNDIIRHLKYVSSKMNIAFKVA